MNCPEENRPTWMPWSTYKKMENTKPIDPNLEAYLHYRFRQLEPTYNPSDMYFEASEIGITFINISGDCLEFELHCLYADGENSTPPEEMITVLHTAIIFRKCLQAISPEYVCSYQHDAEDGSLYVFARRKIDYTQIEEELEAIRDLLGLALRKED